MFIVLIIWIACGMFAAGYLMPMKKIKNHWLLFGIIAYYLLLGLISWPFMLGVIIKEKLG